MFKKKTDDDKRKPVPSQEVKISLDTLETESVAEQLREIERKKNQAKDKGKTKP